jgi:hypothetical protein
VDDMPSISEWILYLIYLSNEKYQLVSEEFESCINVSLHVDLHSHENDVDTNNLVEHHIFGSLFIFGDIYKREHVSLEEVYVSSHHSIPLVFPSDEKQISCIVNGSLDISIVEKKEGFHADNEKNWVTTILMSGSHCPILFFPSEKTKEETTKKDEENVICLKI